MAENTAYVTAGKLPAAKSAPDADARKAFKHNSLSALIKPMKEERVLCQIAMHVHQRMDARKIRNSA